MSYGYCSVHGVRSPCQICAFPVPDGLGVPPTVNPESTPTDFEIVDRELAGLFGPGYTTPIRWTEEAYFLGIAEAVSRRGTCGRLRVGAILVKDGDIISTGYNGAAAGESHCVHTDNEPCRISVHAEVNTIVRAARHHGGALGSDMYLTHAPCYACAGLIINAGIREVTYAQTYKNNDGVERLLSVDINVFRGGY